MSVTKFQEEKWKKGFHFFDVDKDGYVTKHDLETIATYISKETMENEEETVKTRDDWIKWMTILLPGDSMEKNVSEEMWVQAGTDLYKDKENMRRLNAETYSRLFDNVDMNKDGRISIDELKIYYGAHGVKDERFIRRVFDQLDTDKDGHIDRDELIKAGVNYWTSADENDGYAFIYDHTIDGSESA